MAFELDVGWLYSIEFRTEKADDPLRYNVKYQIHIIRPMQDATERKV